MKRIGILCASDAELAPYLTKTEKQPIAEAAMLKFTADISIWRRMR